jgi:AcrR family transcriptional regulator
VTREKRRRQVLQSAKAVFGKKGYHQASIADIIQRAGIARGTFYLYFKNKRHIFRFLLEAFLEELDRRIQTIIVGAGNPPPLEQLRGNLQRVIALAAEEPYLVRILFRGHAGSDEELDRDVHRFYERVADRIECAIRQGIEIGLVRPCDTRLVAYGVLGGIKEVMGQLAFGRISTFQFKAAADSLMEFGLRGVLVESV